MALKAMLNPPFLDMMSDKNFLVVLGRRSGNVSCVETNYFNPDELPAHNNHLASDALPPLSVDLLPLFWRGSFNNKHISYWRNFGGTCTSMVMTQPDMLLIPL